MNLDEARATQNPTQRQESLLSSIKLPANTNRTGKTENKATCVIKGQFKIPSD